MQLFGIGNLPTKNSANKLIILIMYQMLMSTTDCVATQIYNIIWYIAQSWHIIMNSSWWSRILPWSVQQVLHKNNDNFKSTLYAVWTLSAKIVLAVQTITQ